MTKQKYRIKKAVVEAQRFEGGDTYIQTPGGVYRMPTIVFDQLFDLVEVGVHGISHGVPKE